MEPLELKIEDRYWRITRLNAHEEFKIEAHTKGVGWDTVAEAVALEEDESLAYDGTLTADSEECVRACIEHLMERESFFYGLVQHDARSAAVDALELIGRYGGIDGAHHKQWVLDQAVRALTGENYEAWLKEQCDGEDGPDTYEWDEGIAP